MSHTSRYTRTFQTGQKGALGRQVVAQQVDHGGVNPIYFTLAKE